MNRPNDPSNISLLSCCLWKRETMTSRGSLMSPIDRILPSRGEYGRWVLITLGMVGCDQGLIRLLAPSAGIVALRRGTASSPFHSFKLMRVQSSSRVQLLPDRG